jgi:3-dehydroquinate synthase
LKAIEVEANEQNKTLATCEKLLIQLSTLKVTRNETLQVIGGGFLQDIGTLVSSLYMRGIDWIYFPTTLAAMGDSCIGGKSSINAGSIKNLVGNIYPPKAVKIDVGFVSTLPHIEIIAGLSEIIKICYAHSPEAFDNAAKLVRVRDLQFNTAKLSELIQLSLESKKYFVEEDEFDQGIRKLLNFGHTFGHALEVATEFRIPHGVAVLIGMLAAIEHPDSVQSKATESLAQLCFELLESVSEYLKANLDFNIDVFQAAIKSDKKNTNTELVLILPSNTGLAIVKRDFANGAVDMALQSITNAVERIKSEVF